MSQRNSGYARQPHDLYETPEWVTEALLPHLPTHLTRTSKVWEPAAGRQRMARTLREHFWDVRATDLLEGKDFLEQTWPGADAIITNPPFALARKFIEHALTLAPIVAMLFRADYDSGKTRRYLFRDCPAFAKKVVLTRRIVWFERKGAAPSYNHAWYIWDRAHEGPPTLAYGP